MFYHSFTNNNPEMSASSPSSSMRRRFLRIISFGRYASRSADDAKSIKQSALEARRHSAPPHFGASSRNASEIILGSRVITPFMPSSPQSSDDDDDDTRTVIVHNTSDRVPTAGGFSVEAFRDQYRKVYHQEENTKAGQDNDSESSSATSGEYIFSPDSDDSPVFSHVACTNCNEVWDINRLHCPGCAARTLVPTELDSSSASRQDRAIANGAATTAVHNTQAAARHPERRDADGQEQNNAPHRETFDDSWITTTSNAAEATDSQHPQDHPRLAAEMSPRCCHAAKDCHPCHPLQLSFFHCGKPIGDSAEPCHHHRHRLSDQRQCKCRRWKRCNSLVVYSGCRFRGDEWLRLADQEQDERACKSCGKVRETGWLKKTLRWFCCC